MAMGNVPGDHFVFNCTNYLLAVVVDNSQGTMDLKIETALKQIHKM